MVFLLTSILPASLFGAEPEIYNEIEESEDVEVTNQIEEENTYEEEEGIDYEEIANKKHMDSSGIQPSACGHAPKVKLDDKMREKQLQSVVDSVYGMQVAAATASTPALTITSTTSTSITLSVTYPTSGNWGNVLVVWDMNVARPVLDSVFQPYQDNYYRTNGTCTISGLKHGGVYIIWEYWSTDGVWTGGNNAICKTVQLPYTNTASFSRKDGTYVFTNFETADTNLASTTNFNTWMSRMDSAYLALKELVGKVPYSGGKIELKSARDGFIEHKIDGGYYWMLTWGFSGNPAKLWQPFVKSHMMRLSDGDWGDTAIHELSHDFDDYSWLFDPEFFADFKEYYVVESLPAKVYRIDTEKYYTGSSFADFFKTDQYWSYDNTFPSGYYSSRGMVSVFIRIKNTIGWQPFKSTFRYFSSMPAEQFPVTNIEKFNLFIAKLSEYSGYDVKSLLTSNEINVIQNGLGGSIAAYNDATMLHNTIPEVMEQGKTYAVDVTVKNTGLNTWSTVNGYKLGAVGDTDPFASNRQLLAAGDKIGYNQTKTFSFNMVAPQATGNYTTDWRMLKDTGTWFGGILTKAVTVKSNPDLIVTNITWSPQNPKEGDLITFSATVKNNGLTATAATTHYTNFVIDGSSSSAPRGSYSTVINPGAVVTINAATTWKATAGNHSIVANVDCTNVIAESNENNNSYSTNIIFKPDLIITDITKNIQEPIATYSNIPFIVKIKNIGNANYSYSSGGNAVRTELYANGSKIYSKDIPITIQAGKEVTFDASWKPTIINNYTISAIVDTSGVCSESNENNNSYTYPTPINILLDDNETLNNTLVGATVLPLGQSYLSKISSSGDQDYYKVTVPSPSSDSYLYVQLSVPSKPGSDPLEFVPVVNYELELRDSSDSVITMDVSSYMFSQVEYRLTSGSTYYIKVFPYDEIEYSTEHFYTVKASVIPIENGDYNYGGEEYGWDYTGSKLDVHTNSIPIYYESSMNDEWSTGTMFSDIMDGGVNIWNNANLRVPPSTSPIFNKVSSKPTGVTCITARKINDSRTSMVASYKSGTVSLNEYLMTENLVLPDLSALQSGFAVTAHELGHALGLEDLYVNGEYTINGQEIINNDKLMFGLASQRLADNRFADNSLRYLHEKDIEGVQEIQNWVNRYVRMKSDTISSGKTAELPNTDCEYATASYFYISEEELYNSADIIVRGKVKKISDSVLSDTNSNYSEVILKVDKYYRDNIGSEEEELVFLQEGDSCLQYKENLLFQKGEECILFLRRSEFGDLVILGGPQGRYDIMNTMEKSAQGKMVNMQLAENHLSRYIREKVEAKGLKYNKVQKSINEFELSIEKEVNKRYERQ